MMRIEALDRLGRARVLLNRRDKAALKARKKRKAKRKYQLQSQRMICSVRVEQVQRNKSKRAALLSDQSSKKNQMKVRRRRKV